MNKQKNKFRKKTGAAASAILASSIGCVVIGINTVLAMSFPEINRVFTWWSPAGSLTGKAGVGIIAWLVCWVFLHYVWRNKNPHMPTIATISFVLLVISIVALFPPFFDLFKP
ncbi:MAG: hypothetical protein K1000chlam4_00572 [Chlamydiae bacterium]|nr:hypothetical protein [Chlamydiota bacterium]